MLMKWLVFTLLILGLGCNASQAQKSAVTCIWHYNPDHVTYLPHSNYGKVVYYIQLPKVGDKNNYKRRLGLEWVDDDFIPILPIDINQREFPLPEGYCISEGDYFLEEKETLIRTFKENEYVMPYGFNFDKFSMHEPSPWSGFEILINSFHGYQNMDSFPRKKYRADTKLKLIGERAGRYSWLRTTGLIPFRYHADEGKLYMLTSFKVIASIEKRTDMPLYKYIYKDSVAYFQAKEEAYGSVQYDFYEMFYPGKNFYDYVTNYGQPNLEFEKPELYALFGRGERNYLMACCLLPMEKGEGELVITTVGGRELERYPLTTMLNYIEIATKSVPEVVLTLYVNGEKIKSFTSPTSKI